MSEGDKQLGNEGEATSEVLDGVPPAPEEASGGAADDSAAGAESKEAAAEGEVEDAIAEPGADATSEEAPGEASPEEGGDDDADAGAPAEAEQAAAASAEDGADSGDGPVEEVSLEEASEFELSSIEFLESQMDAMKAELGALRNELDSAQKQAKQADAARLRLQADWDNFRKRQERDVARLKEERAEKILVNILPVLDTFGRAIDQYEKDNSEDALYDGLQRIEKMFEQLLEKEGVTKIEAKGKPFDPNLHDALCRVPIPEDGFDDMVVDVFETGYLMGEKVIKPAKVSVGKEEA